LRTLAEVENCEYVREQRRVDLNLAVRGMPRLLPPTPMLDGSVVVREAGRVSRRDSQYMNARTGRRPLDGGAVERLAAAIAEPLGWTG
jgi:hypothetical protein